MARTGKGGSGRGGKGAGGGGASSGAIRAGGAFVELFTKDGALRKGLKAASETVAEWAKSVTKYAAAGLAGAGLAIGAAIGHFVNRGDSIKKASDRLGISAETLSALGYAADQSGSSLEGLEKGIRFLQKTVNEAVDGSAEAAESFTELGLVAQDLKDMKPDEMWLAVADSLSRVENVTERNALAMKAFGKSGVDLVPLLIGGSKGVRSLMEEAGRTGQVVTAEQAAAAEKIGDAFERVWASIKGAIFAVGAALTPVAGDIEKVSLFVVDVVKRFSDWVQTANVLGETFSGLREQWNTFFEAYENADLAGKFQQQTALMELAWANLTSFMQKSMEKVWTAIARVVNAGVFTVQDLYARVTGGDREKLRADAIATDLELQNMKKESIAAIEQKRLDAKAKFDNIVNQNLNQKVNKQVPDVRPAERNYQRFGTSTHGAFNFANAGQLFGGSSPFQRLEKQGDEQNGLLRDLIAAMRNVPLARL